MKFRRRMPTMGLLPFRLGAAAADDRPTRTLAVLCASRRPGGRSLGQS